MTGAAAHYRAGMVRPDQPDDPAAAGSTGAAAEPAPDPEDDPTGDAPAWAGAPGYHAQDTPPDDTADDDPADDDPGTVADRPGYQRVPDGMAAHAPMPGAPPYPAQVAPTAGPGPRLDAIPFSRALAAAAIWLTVNLLINIVFYGSPGSLVGVAMLLGFTLVLGLGLWFLLRERTPAFWQVVLIAAPLYWILRIVLFPWLI